MCGNLFQKIHVNGLEGGAKQGSLTNTIFDQGVGPVKESVQMISGELTKSLQGDIKDFFSVRREHSLFAFIHSGNLRDLVKVLKGGMIGAGGLVKVGVVEQPMFVNHGP